MADRSRYHVTKQGDGWVGKKEGASRPSVVEPTKQKAIDRTVDIAKNGKPSQVVIHKENGVIQSERTYGGDPYPPKG